MAEPAVSQIIPGLCPDGILEVRIQIAGILAILAVGIGGAPIQEVGILAVITPAAPIPEAGIGAVVPILAVGILAAQTPGVGTGVGDRIRVVGIPVDGIQAAVIPEAGILAAAPIQVPGKCKGNNHGMLSSAFNLILADWNCSTADAG